MEGTTTEVGTQPKGKHKERLMNKKGLNELVVNNK